MVNVKSKPKKKATTRKTSSKNKKVKTKKKAFTLIELLAVVIILGVIMIIAIPGVTSYITTSRKNVYVTSAKKITQGAINLVNSGELPVFDKEVTYYIPHDMVSTEKGGNKSPYGEYTSAYVVVSYTGNGYEYYWTSTDTSKTGIYLTYYDSLDKNRVLTGVEGDLSNISICGKDHIIIFNSDGTVKEEKEAEDCLEPRGSYEKGNNSACEYKIVSDYGSFSPDGDVKEICVKLDNNYTYNYEYTPALYGGWTSTSIAVLTVELGRSAFKANSYVRVYNNSNKDVLLGEVTINDFPKYDYTVQSPWNSFSWKIQKRLGTIEKNGYYIDMSDDLRAVANDWHDVYVMYGNTSDYTENGPWYIRQKDIEKVQYLYDSIDLIPIESVCTNPAPTASMQILGFQNIGNNTYKANVIKYCEGTPK